MKIISDTVTRKFEESYDITEWEIDTDSGWCDATQIHKTIPYTVFKLVTESGLEFLCADNHIVFLEDYSEIFCKDLIPNKSKIITRYGVDLIMNIQNLGYDDNMYDITVASDHHRYYTNDILSHNTTTSVAYLLWEVLFHDAHNTAILANKGQTARDILGKLQLAYENLPIWLQQGIITWNKSFIELENGSKIVASSTSSSASRSGSYNTVFLDEFAFVPSSIANEFMQSVYPVITAGTKTKIIIVSTPNGMNLFYKIWTDAINKRNNYVTYEVHWSQVPGRDEAWEDETRKNIGDHNFDQEFNCNFLGSTNTLISSTKLQQLVFIDPITQHDDTKIYEYPIKGDDDGIKDHLYCISVDVSEGRNMDASSFSVFDISSTPYKQVATYCNSNISPILFPTIIYNAARLYNDAYILVEINNNPQVADIIHQDLEYENLFKIMTGNKKPQQLCGGFGRGVQMGLKMSPAVKRIGCSNLKTLIEGNKLQICDFETVSELTTFVANKTSFAAESDAHDDLAMTLVIFAWVTTQKYFRDIVAHDIRKQIQLESLNQVDDESLPAPIIEDGFANEFDVIDGDVWEKADSGEVYAGFFREMMRN